MPDMSDVETPKSKNLFSYTLSTQVAEGNFGDILLARDANGNVVAVKRVRLASEAKRRKLVREVEVLKLCRGHECVVQLVEYLETDDFAYLIIEMAFGNLLERLVGGEAYGEGSVSRAVRDVASALSFLHGRGIAHRDVKPENILCFSRVDISPLKLCDFDLSSYDGTQKQQLQTQRTEFKTHLGSFQYMAPEVASVWLGERSSYRKECDLWSLGAIMYVTFFRKSLFAYPSFDLCPLKCNGECEECEAVQLKIVRGGRFVVPPDMIRLSSDAVGLLFDLLRVEPESRISADRVLRHDWIVGRGSQQ